MSHEITSTDHMVSGNNIVPWHGLGTVVDGALTAREALVEAKLDWTVAKKNLQVAGGRSFKDRFAIVREDNGDPLGVVGNRYTPIQNVDGLDILDPVIGEDAVYETAGSLRGGKIVWFLARLNEEYFLSGKSDPMRQYCLVFLSHDGTKPVSVRFVSTRVVCWNTLAAALHEAASLAVIRHTRNFKDKVEEAHRVIGLANTHAREFQKIYAQLQSTKMSEKEAGRFTEAWLPGEGKRVVGTRERVVELFRGGIGNEGKTRADMLNGVTEFLTHHRNVRKTNAAETRFETNLMSYGVDMQRSAVELLLN